MTEYDIEISRYETGLAANAVHRQVAEMLDVPYEAVEVTVRTDK